MSDPSLSPQEFLEIVAGEVCLCGHKHEQHEPPNPDFKAGDFVEVRGACHECDCKGEIA